MRHRERQNGEKNLIEQLEAIVIFAKAVWVTW